MDILKRIKLNQLRENELNERQMRAIKGGDNCGCGCHYQHTGGGSSTQDNYNANLYQGKNSYGGNIACGNTYNEATKNTH